MQARTDILAVMILPEPQSQRMTAFCIQGIVPAVKKRENRSGRRVQAEASPSRRLHSKHRKEETPKPRMPAWRCKLSPRPPYCKFLTVGKSALCAGVPRHPSAQRETGEMEHPASGDTPAWTERILTVTITTGTLEDTRVFYSYAEEQNEALNQLLADLDPERQAVVEIGCRLVGKVNCFWGGKSLVIFRDSRWGQLTKVWAFICSTPTALLSSGIDTTLRVRILSRR